MERADTPTGRMRLLVDRVSASRSAESEVRFRSDRGTVVYGDRLARLDLDGAERDRLEDLLGRFPVFKLKQPETRKAPEGVVYVSAKADPKHAADFLEGVFRVVYTEPEGYELRADEP